MVQKHNVTREYEDVIADTPEEALEYCMEHWVSHTFTKVSDVDSEFVSAELTEGKGSMFALDDGEIEELERIWYY